MYDLTKDEKLDFIIKKSKELEITPYDFGNNTEISVQGASNILERKSKNPRTKNLNIMMQYLESKVVGTQYKEGDIVNKVEEPTENIVDQVGNKALKKISQQLEINEYILRELLLEVRQINKKTTN